MEDYMIYEVYDDILYIPRGIKTWLANRPEEKKIFEEWLAQKKKRYYIHYIALSSFGTRKYGCRTMRIKKRNTSFHADGNSDIAKIRRELKIDGGYAYVMTFDGGFKVGLTNDLKRRLSQLNSGSKRHYEIVWSSSFSNYEAAAMMECDLHSYYKNLYPDHFVPNDHFDIDGFNAGRDVRKLNMMAKECEARYAA